MFRRQFLTAATLLAQPPYTSLFNGRNLDGWQVVDGPESAFYVDDGAIVVSEAANSPTCLRTAKQYENFEFRAEFFV